MKLGAAHQDPNAARPRPPKDFPAPPGFRLVERVEGRGAEAGRPHGGGPCAAWTADGPGGSRVVLSAYKIDPRDAQADGPKAVHALRAARHPNLLAILGAWGANGTLVIATEPAPHSLLDRFEEAKAAGAAGIDRDTLTDALADAGKALDYLNDLYPDRGHGDVGPDAIRVIGGGVKLAPPDPWSWLRTGRTDHPDRPSDQARLAAVYAYLRGGGPAETGASPSADLGALPKEERRAVSRALSDDPEVQWPSCRAFIDGLRADVRAAEALVSLSAPFLGEGAAAVRVRAAARPVVGKAQALAFAAATGLTAAAATLCAVRFAADPPAPRPLPGRPALLAGVEPSRYRLQDASVPDAPSRPAPPPRRPGEAEARGEAEPPASEAETTEVASDASDEGAGEVRADTQSGDGAGPLLASAVRPPATAPDAAPEAAASPVFVRPALSVRSPAAFTVVGGRSTAFPVDVASSGVTPPEFDVRLSVEGLPKGVRAEARSVRLAAAAVAHVALSFTAAEDADADATVRLVASSPGLGERVETVTSVRLSVRPRPGLLARRRGDEALRLEAHDQAIRAYDEALGEAPGDLAALHGRGLANYGKGDLDRALADLGEAAKLGPDDASVRNNLGLARLAKGDAAGARSDFEAALKLDPGFAVVHYNLGRTFAQTGDSSRAVAEYDETVRLNPTFAKAFKARADALARLGDRTRALADYDEAVRLNPDDAASLNNRGLLRLARGEPQRAIADFDEASRLNPAFAVVHYNRGRVYAQLGDATEAIASFDRALKLDPKFVRAYKARAESYTKRGDLARAGGDRDEAARLEAPPSPGVETPAVTSAPTAFFGKPTAGR